MTNQTITAQLSGTIEPSEMRRLVEANPDIRLIDVRTDAEFESRYIPGSHHLPLPAIDAHLDALVSIDAPLVLVCKSGARAADAHARLTAGGRKDVGTLSGGIDAWQAEGGDVAQSGTERWAMDRQVRLVAGSLTLLGIGASVVAPKAKWLAGTIGAGLTFSAVSNTCAMANGLARLPYNRASNPTDTAAVIADLRRGTNATPMR